LRTLGRSADVPSRAASAGDEPWVAVETLRSRLRSLALLSLAIGPAACLSAGPSPVQRAVPAADLGAIAGRSPRLSPPLRLALPDDAVVRIVTDGATCSGTLIAPDLVLTAHHCIVERDESGVALDRDLAASSVSVELGGDYLPWGTVGVRAVVAPPCGHRGGNGDLAVLVLGRKLGGVRPMAPRLVGPVRVGETIEPVGFGRCSLSRDGIHRSWRDGGPVQTVNPGTVVANASICPGDSGGPARVAGTAEVVGVVSAAVMDGDDKTREPAIFTRIDAWREVFALARQIADGANPAELPPVGGCHDEL
jgi:V8-like Glu-specific endopeptidase